MEIKEIKKHLSILVVLIHYGLSPDRNDRLLCPWHNDKTPSLQIYPKTNTWTCFSTNCSAGSGDQIEMIQRLEKCSKHEAILKAKSLIGTSISITPKITLPMKSDYSKLFIQLKSNFKSGQAVKYLEQRKLNRKQIEVGYNANTWEHLRYCLVFALRNPKNEIVSFYGRSIYDNKDQRHFYLKNRNGLYPKYPSSGTHTLVLTESVIDAATLLQVDLGTAKDGTGMEVLALYGTNGLTEEHEEAIKNLTELQEVILFFDGDEAGRRAIEKWSPKIKDLHPEIKVSYVATPEGEDVNSLFNSHEPEVFHHLLSERMEYKTGEQGFLFSVEKSSNEKSTENKKPALSLSKGAKEMGLDTSNPNNIHYRGKTAEYYIKGTVKGGLESLKVSLQILNDEGEDYRAKLDLYDYKQVGAVARIAAEKLDLSEAGIEKDLSRLAWLVERWREQQQRDGDKGEGKKEVVVPELAASECLKFLRQKGLLKAINGLIGKSGIIGEEKNRIFLFVIASSYKMADTLHALVQGSSGSGKTHLIIKISLLMPPEDVITLTRITDSSLYNYGEYELQNILMVLEDLDGLKEDAFLAFRELQSREMLSSSTSVKDESGNIKSEIRIVRGPVGSLSATTKGSIYEDNMSRCFLIAVDESGEQTLRVIDYQNQLAAGIIKKTEQKKTRLFLQNCVRLLKPGEVINPYAGKIKLPQQADKIRRLNELFQSFIKQVTLINQYGRKKDKQGRLITEKEDIRDAVEVMFESIVLKVDELDGSLRQFFEQLKSYLSSKDQEFGQREVRQALRISKTQLQRHIRELMELEYIQQLGGHANRGYRYRICYWDSIEKLRKRIQDDLKNQLDRL